MNRIACTRTFEVGRRRISFPATEQQSLRLSLARKFGLTLLAEHRKGLVHDCRSRTFSPASNRSEDTALRARPRESMTHLEQMWAEVASRKPGRLPRNPALNEATERQPALGVCAWLALLSRSWCPRHRRVRGLTRPPRTQPESCLADGIGVCSATGANRGTPRVVSCPRAAGPRSFRPAADARPRLRQPPPCSRTR